MQILRLFFLIPLALLVTPALAAQNWEICLDKADFSLSVDEFKGSISVVKNHCQFTFSLSGGKGERLVINLCDSNVHIDHYASLEGDGFRRLKAGPGACPSPLFGADFDENFFDYKDFKEMRTRVFALFEKLKQTHGEGSDQVDISKPNAFSPAETKGKIACAQYLLKEYLKNCSSFEGSKAENKSAVKAFEPGVHPQTILAPKR